MLLFSETVDSDPLLDASAGSDTDSEPVYGNIGFDVAPVKVEDLWDYVKNNKCNDCEGFRREYKVRFINIRAKHQRLHVFYTFINHYHLHWLDRFLGQDR